jgi:hypothetical protein
MTATNRAISFNILAGQPMREEAPCQKLKVTMKMTRETTLSTSAQDSHR